MMQIKVLAPTHRKNLALPRRRSGFVSKLSTERASKLFDTGKSIPPDPTGDTE
jgi:hypothetical protein